MTYKTLEEIERFTDPLTAEQVARDYWEAERDHVRRVRKAIDSFIADERANNGGAADRDGDAVNRVPA